jgi:cytochrome c
MMRAVLFCLMAIFALKVSAEDVSRGQALFEVCVACHSVEPGVHGIGPSLAGIYERRSGTVEGYRFSSALKRSGLQWNETELDRYLKNPQDAIPGGRMPYSGMPDAADRKALIQFLKTLQ